MSKNTKATMQYAGGTLKLQKGLGEDCLYCSQCERLWESATLLSSWQLAASSILQAAVRSNVSALQLV